MPKHHARLSSFIRDELQHDVAKALMIDTLNREERRLGRALTVQEARALALKLFKPTLVAVAKS